jgi:hypothetical protein
MIVGLGSLVQQSNAGGNTNRQRLETNSRLPLQSMLGRVDEV